jgi:hypothetical protein
MVDFDQRFEHEGSLCESGIETHQWWAERQEQSSDLFSRLLKEYDVVEKTVIDGETLVFC